MLTTLTILLVWGAAIALVLAFFRGADIASEGDDLPGAGTETGRR